MRRPRLIALAVQAPHVPAAPLCAHAARSPLVSLGLSDLLRLALTALRRCEYAQTARRSLVLKRCNAATQVILIPSRASPEPRAAWTRSMRSSGSGSALTTSIRTAPNSPIGPIAKIHKVSRMHSSGLHYAQVLAPWCGQAGMSFAAENELGTHLTNIGEPRHWL